MFYIKMVAITKMSLCSICNLIQCSNDTMTLLGKMGSQIIRCHLIFVDFEYDLAWIIFFSKNICPKIKALFL